MLSNPPRGPATCPASGRSGLAHAGAASFAQPRYSTQNIVGWPSRAVQQCDDFRRLGTVSRRYAPHPFSSAQPQRFPHLPDKFDQSFRSCTGTRSRPAASPTSYFGSDESAPRSRSERGVRGGAQLGMFTVCVLPGNSAFNKDASTTTCGRPHRPGQPPASPSRPLTSKLPDNGATTLRGSASEQAGLHRADHRQPIDLCPGRSPTLHGPLGPSTRWQRKAPATWPAASDRDHQQRSGMASSRRKRPRPMPKRELLTRSKTLSGRDVTSPKPRGTVFGPLDELPRGSAV